MQQLISKNDLASLDIILGPMYAGKTTELIRRLNIFSLMGFKCLFINSSLDNRSIEDFSTHNPSIKKMSKNIDSMKIDQFNNKVFDRIKLYDIIAIDETQLFKNLKDNVIHIVEILNKKVIISGLNGDFQRNKFGEIIDLIPICDNIDKLSPFCLLCCQNNNIIKPALFSKRISKETETISIGGSDKYVPVCRKCFHN